MWNRTDNRICEPGMVEGFEQAIMRPGIFNGMKASVACVTRMDFVDKGNGAVEVCVPGNGACGQGGCSCKRAFGTSKILEDYVTFSF